MTNDLCLSVVVIGRNEAAGLARLAASLAPLLAQVSAETIYVDSASSDDSVAIAHTHFDLTLELAQDKNLNASAGRYAGTAVAKGQWLLFLDGDMELAAESVAALLAHMADPAERHGAIGNYVHHYDDGSSRVWEPRVLKSGIVDHFGGAVMLPASALRLEGWDPRFFSNEESDLNARLASHGLGVKSLGVDFIVHSTESYSAWTKLRSIFIPRGSFLGKKFGGFGQVVHARVLDGRIFDMMRSHPEPFALWLGTLLSLILVPAAGAAVGLLPILASALFILARRPARFLIIYYAFAVQAVYGWPLLARHWVPVVVRSHRREA